MGELIWLLLNFNIFAIGYFSLTARDLHLFRGKYYPVCISGESQYYSTYCNDLDFQCPILCSNLTNVVQITVSLFHKVSSDGITKDFSRSKTFLMLTWPWINRWSSLLQRFIASNATPYPSSTWPKQCWLSNSKNAQSISQLSLIISASLVIIRSINPKMVWFD